jgi:hypothetical protein
MRIPKGPTVRDLARMLDHQTTGMSAKKRAERERAKKALRARCPYLFEAKSNEEPRQK